MCFQIFDYMCTAPLSVNVFVNVVISSSKLVVPASNVVATVISPFKLVTASILPLKASV